MLYIEIDRRARTVRNRPETVREAPLRQVDDAEKPSRFFPRLGKFEAGAAKAARVFDQKIDNRIHVSRRQERGNRSGAENFVGH